jgi:hypothetical protein
VGVNVKTGVITAPTVTGQVTYDLPAGFTPKALLLVATYQTAAGREDGHAILSLGFGTYHGATVQQQYIAGIMEDASSGSNTAGGHNMTAILKGYSAAIPTVDYEAHLVSLTSDSFVLDWINAPASAILVHYMALGGSDIAAYTGSFAMPTDAADHDVVVTTGFGQPNLVLFVSVGKTTDGDAVGLSLSFGAAMSDSECATTGMWAPDATATVDMTVIRQARAFASLHGIANEQGILAPRSEWPTDGFRLTYPVAPISGFQVGYLALAGAFMSNVGKGGGSLWNVGEGPPASSFELSSGTLKGAVFWGTEACASILHGDAAQTEIINASDTDLGGFWIGMTDGVTQGMCAFVILANQADVNAGRVFLVTKVAATHRANFGAAAPTMVSEADALVQTRFVTLDWTTPNPRDTDWNYLIVGERPPDWQETKEMSAVTSSARGSRG